MLNLASGTVVDASLWKPLRLFNLYRLAVAGLFLAIVLSTGDEVLGEQHPELFRTANGLYVFFSLTFSVSSHYRWPAFNLQVLAQAFIDILAIALLMYASGGVGSGLGLLMIAPVAAATLMAPGRSALGIAAAGALALLLAEIYFDISTHATTTSYTQTSLLGASLFLTAWLALTLAHRAKQSEALATRRGIDLANLAELSSLIVNRMQAGILVVDDAAKVRLINRTARSLLGCSVTDHLGGLKDLSQPLYRMFVDWLPTQDNNAPPRKLELGAAANLQARFTRVGARREDRGSVIYLEDTARINRQIQETKLASLSRLTASIAHEIRNPLGAISHAAQLLGESPKLDTADQRMVGIIQEQSKRMNAIIHDVLRLYRKEQPKPERLALKSWLEQFNDQFSRANGVKPQWASLSIDPEAVCVYMDPNHLQQVLWNLCCNALKYGIADSGSPAVTLMGGQSQERAASFLDVVDRGPGIRAELRAQLFEPFFTTSAQGTGLGLFIARELCESNGGDLSYRPNPQGGSCFRIHFPVDHQQADSDRIEEHRVAASAYR